MWLHLLTGVALFVRLAGRQAGRRVQLRPNNTVYSGTPLIRTLVIRIGLALRVNLLRTLKI
jgi:hypothetical protein